MKRDVIIACDFAGREETLRFLDQFENEKPFVKIGMELFYGEGPQIVREIKARGHEVFLDLKLHDIPNTVKKAMRNLAALGADMVNLHAAGGSAMMRAALEGLEAGAKGARPRLIAVTQLTSTSVLPAWALAKSVRVRTNTASSSRFGSTTAIFTSLEFAVAASAPLPMARLVTPYSM